MTMTKKDIFTVVGVDSQFELVGSGHSYNGLEFMKHVCPRHRQDGTGLIFIEAK